MNQHGFLKVAMAVPKVKIADPHENVNEIVSLTKTAVENGADLVLFPELSLTAYSCGDLFLHSSLLLGAEQALAKLLSATKKVSALVVVGMPVSDNRCAYNASVIIQNGTICGVVPKYNIPNYGEYSEGRWFASGMAATSNEITLCGQKVPFGQMIFKNDQAAIGVEICEDLMVSNSPSGNLSLYGAEVICNLSASNAVVGKRNTRKMLVQNRSFLSHCAYVYTSAGPSESTTDTVYSGHVLVAENGALLLDEQDMQFESALYYTDIDIECIQGDRKRLNTFTASKEDILTVELRPFPVKDVCLSRAIPSHPFVPEDVQSKNERFSEIYQTLATALARRLMHTKAKTAVIGISGGLDSTLALLVAAHAMDILKRPRTDILALTMPGFGTTDRTLQNAKKLMDHLGTTSREISIADACLQHFKDIGHDPKVTDVTYENTQARERTQILMDVANQTGGLVIGTGDLSELALGWATYAGDHISMYGVNAGVPKTLVRHLVDWIAQNKYEGEIKTVLADVLDTPVSPELLPANEQTIAQKTEEIIGNYELHDFFLYYFLRFGFSKEKILYLATCAFGDKYNSDSIEKVLTTFLRRFFQNQFKRSCLPDGPKIGSVSLSPRTDLHLPSDASADLWLQQK
ncbi:MAG: NAD(+) synthase [Clostridia bacterium]|nr:NAD(+) synthase [Clostridia bacterium]